MLWIGKLREFSAKAASEANRPGATDLEKIDQAVAAKGTRAVETYAQGREHVHLVLKKFDERIAADPTLKVHINQLERPRIDKYASFSIEAAVQKVLDGMNEN